MNDQEKHHNGNLVPAGRRELAPVAYANPLVARGLADIAIGTFKAIGASAVDLKNALSCFFGGDLDEAIRLFSEAIRLDPNNAFAYRHRGRAYWWKNLENEGRGADEEQEATCSVSSNEENCYEKAMKDFDEAIRLDPDNSIAYVERAEAWFWGNSFEKGIDDFDEAIRADPNHAGWYALRGCAWFEERDYDKAIMDFNEAIRLNANNLPYVLIVFTKSEGQETQYEDYDSGNPTCSRCVRINLYDKLASAYNARGQIWLDNEDYDKAIKDFSEVIRLDPKDALGHNFRGFAWMHKGDFRKAITDFDDSIRLKPSDVHAYVVRGVAWMGMEDYAKAIKDYDEVIRLNPNRASAYGFRGRAWLRNGDYDKAIRDLDEAIRLDPEDDVAYTSRGEAWEYKGDHDKAMKDFDEAIRLDPIDS